MVECGHSQKQKEDICPYCFAADCLENYKQKLEDALWIKIDWSRLLYNAIQSRPTSWKNAQDAVLNWGNASDEICSALVKELIRLDILVDSSIDRLKRAQEWIKEAEIND